MIITIKAFCKFWFPKNTIDHAALRISWRIKITDAILTVVLLIPFRMTRKNEIPIMVYKEVHTGAKTQFGGEIPGRFKVTYQFCIASIVK